MGLFDISFRKLVRWFWMWLKNGLYTQACNSYFCNRLLVVYILASIMPWMPWTPWRLAARRWQRVPRQKLLPLNTRWKRRLALSCLTAWWKLSSEVKKNRIPTPQVLAAKNDVWSGKESQGKARKTVVKAYPVAGQILNTLHNITPVVPAISNCIMCFALQPKWYLKGQLLILELNTQCLFIVMWWCIVQHA